MFIVCIVLDKTITGKHLKTITLEFIMFKVFFHSQLSIGMNSSFILTVTRWNENLIRNSWIFLH